MTHRPSKPFDLTASHPRPDVRSATNTANTPTPTPFTQWDPKTAGTPSAQAASQAQTTWAPKPATPPVSDPTSLKNHPWQAEAQTDFPDGNGFTDANALLQQMGLPPLKTTHEHRSTDKPLIERMPASSAEFSPPRPLRRQPVRFAHLKPEADTKS